MKTELNDLILLENDELAQINGGSALVLGAFGIIVAYNCWAFEFIYNMAKD